MNNRFLALIFCILCFVPATFAQSRDVWVTGGVTNNRNDKFIGTGWNIGFRLAFNTAGSFGHEFQYTYSQPSFAAPGNPRMEIHQAGYNFLYFFTPRESTVRPLVTAGIHLNDFVLPGPVSAPEDSSVNFGFNYGAAVKIRLSPIFGFRADVREYETSKPSWGGFFSSPGGLLHSTEASAGFGIYF